MTTEPRVINPGIEALLSNLIDYAGLFPPAKLDMATTVANYARFSASDDAWMLERLIIPVARLDEFEEHASALLPRNADEEPWPISALTAPAGSDGLDADLARAMSFNEKHTDLAAGGAVIDTIELKAADADAVDAALDLIPESIFPFFEIASDHDPRGTIAALVGGDAGAKIRTGGVTPDLYPDPDAVARFIAACAAADVPFKATAGLHHPLRHRNETVGAMEFGFVNVFMAAALAIHREWETDDLRPVLEEAVSEAFTFDASGGAWREECLTVDELQDSRLTFAASFGSCSFDEPREDLRQLGWL